MKTFILVPVEVELETGIDAETQKEFTQVIKVVTPTFAQANAAYDASDFTSYSREDQAIQDLIYLYHH